MSAIERMDVALGIYTDRYMRNVHTNIRGKVVGINLGVPSVDIQPMASTVFDSGTEDKYPVIFDVPLHLPAGNGGKARLTMPVKVGDYVGLSFSERNENSTSDMNTHQLFAGWAVTEIFTEGNAKPIHPDNVVLENDKVKQEMSPDGTIVTTTPQSTHTLAKDGSFEFTNASGSLKVSADGTFLFTNGAVSIQGNKDGTGSLSNAAGGINLKANGETDVNGGLITRDGNFITKAGVNLDAFYRAYQTHIHSGVQTGGGQTGPIVGG